MQASTKKRSISRCVRGKYRYTDNASGKNKKRKRMAMPGNEKCACCVIPAARFQAGLKCSGSSKRKEEVSGVAFLSTHGV